MSLGARGVDKGERGEGRRPIDGPRSNPRLSSPANLLSLRSQETSVNITIFTNPTKAKCTVENRRSESRPSLSKLCQDLCSWEAAPWQGLAIPLRILGVQMSSTASPRKDTKASMSDISEKAEKELEIEMIRKWQEEEEEEEEDDERAKWNCNQIRTKLNHLFQSGNRNS